MRARSIELEGHRASEITAGDLRLVVVHDVGPRVAWFGNRENLLFWDRAGEHRRRSWRLYGGHRLWVARPGADESEETYEPDNQPCDVRATARSLEISAPPSTLGIARSLRIRPERRTLVIEHQLVNRSDMLWSGGAWALTCTRPLRGTRYRIPLGGGCPGWDVATVVIPMQWGGTHSSRLDDPQFSFARDALIVRPRGIEGKRMVAAPAGVLEMIDRRGTFRKIASYEPGASYPLATNLALYIGPDNFMVELETMSPLRTLAPGEILSHEETWSLT